jgi:hypothetical protein
MIANLMFKMSHDFTITEFVIHFDKFKSLDLRLFLYGYSSLPEVTYWIEHA